MRNKNKHSGFPSPADDYEESGLNFNKILIPRPACTRILKILDRKNHSDNVYIISEMNSCNKKGSTSNNIGQLTWKIKKF